MIGVVLAGGQSTRMKQDKALLPYRHHTLLDHAIETLLASGCSKVIVSGEKYGGIADRFTHRGPLAGIDAAIHACRETHYLFVPVDMPMLSSQVLQPLIESLSQERSAHFEASNLPLALHVDEKVIGYIEQQLSSAPGNVSIGALINNINADALRCHFPNALVNTNTPDEWYALNQTNECTTHH